MNKLLLTSALVAAFGAAALAPQAARASDGTITINGTVVASTCTVAVAGQTGNATVTLPPATIAQLAPAKTLVDVTPFTIKVSNCSSYTTATPLFTSSATDAANGALTATNVGTANVTNLDLALVNSDGTTLLDLRQGESTQGASSFALTAGAGSATYNAAYYPTAAVTGAGKITAQATYTMIYQ
jgi:major type 1 subunit fimbrin (pilin)